MADGADQTTRGRRWPYVVVAGFLAPIGAVVLAKGADNWCDSELMAVSEDGSYANKQLSVSLLPPAVECTGDIAGGRHESVWPIDW